MKKLISISFALFLCTVVRANEPIVLRYTLDWANIPTMVEPVEGATKIAIYTFKGAVYNGKTPSIPYFATLFPLSRYGKIEVEIVNAIYAPLDKKPSKDDAVLKNTIEIATKEVQQDRNHFQGRVSFIPIRKIGNSYEKLLSFELNVTFTAQSIGKMRGANTFKSVLSEGDIYKIGVDKSGVQKLSYDFFKNTLKIDPATLNPQKIKIYGNGGGMLPERLAIPRADDLLENAIQVVGEDDGKFDPSDYVLFYANNADRWYLDSAAQTMRLEKNSYSEKSFYFIKTTGDNGKRVVSSPNLNVSPEYTTETFDNIIHFEEDKHNLLSEYPAPAGGKQWFGDTYTENGRTQVYNTPFNFPNILTDSLVRVWANFASRDEQSSNSQFELVTDGKSMRTNTIPQVFSDVHGEVAGQGTIKNYFKAKGEKIDVTVNYKPFSEGKGWLDYIAMHAHCALKMTGEQLLFRDLKSMNYSTTNFKFNDGSVTIWNISNPQQVVKQENNGGSFTTNSKTLQTFVAFNPNASLYIPTFSEKVENQNLHALDNVEMLIVYPKALEAQANALAKHHKEFSGLEVALAETNNVFNEFSSGATDPTAVRDLAKMLYERQPQRFRFLLLFGDGTFDYRNIEYKLGISKEPYVNFVPVFERKESLLAIESFPSDDYFGLLSDNEGNDLSGAVDIAVGRLTANNVEEADAMVEKVIDYETNPDDYNDFRQRVSFIADDEDGASYMSQSNSLADETTKDYPLYNLNKIYLDAYPQIATPGGQRAPEVNEAIANDVFKGALILNYVGHGGPNGWAQERILLQNDVNNWSNPNRLPLFVTATCEFGAYDDPTKVTAGEWLLLLKKRGALALFSTTRAVYSDQNNVLTDALFKEIFKKEGYKGKPIGEILRISKNNSATDFLNTRKFTLLGDPAVRLALPQYPIITTKINGKPLNTNKLDTIKALQKVNIEAAVTDKNGKVLDNFNGKAFVTIYDKEQVLSTLGQDGTPKINFSLQKNVLFKGAATVTKGIFQFTCIVPKDINYNYGFAKISYYATDDNLNDAGGYDKTHLVIGGTDLSLKDDKGPTVEVFMNNESFTIGGTTSNNPTVLAKFKDDNGINVAGTSVGHDLTAILDENPQNTFRLNNFYEATLNDYTSGKARYPLYKLSEGKHSIRVKAWDIANNPGEGTTEFIVAKTGKSALAHVLNYPNPFTTHTAFQFEHDLPYNTLQVLISIYTVAGKLVKVLEEEVSSDAERVIDIKWDGKDDYGDELARGVYVYKIRAKGTGNSTNSAESGFEKLVILK
jgi:Peptidase family C25